MVVTGLANYLDALDRCDQEENIWNKMRRRDVALAKLIMKLPSYRRYYQKYSFEGGVSPLSLDYMITGPYGQTPLVDMIESNHLLTEEEYETNERVSEFKATLTPRQLQVLVLLEAGYRPNDIYEQLGYKNTNGVRYMRWTVKQRYNAWLKAQQQ